MGLTYNDAKPLVFFLAFLLTLFIINSCACGYWDKTTSKEIIPFDSSEWTFIRQARNARTYLRENGLVDERVNDDELDYIFQLAIHLSSYYDNISPELAIATIAQESKFYRMDEYEGALGLMQLLPYYHRERLFCCLEEDERYSDELFFDPRLNIMAGLDYLSQLIDECDGDVTYALMSYNQGPSSARKTYLKSGITSHYAANILELSGVLSSILSES